MTRALLVLIGVLTTASAVLMVASFRRNDDLQGLAAMTLMMLAGIPATVYASLTS